jgi:hypothetical protein
MGASVPAIPVLSPVIPVPWEGSFPGRADLSCGAAEPAITRLWYCDRLNLRFVQQEVKACDSTDIYYGGTTYDSHVVLSGLS